MEEEFNGRCIGDIKGSELDPRLTRQARTEELDEFKQRRVYGMVPGAVVRRGANIVGVRWVDIDKGVPGSSRIRSRLVTQEFSSGSDPTGEFFAPTPPLAATRWLVSGVASRGRAGLGEHPLMLLVVKKAFLYV